MYEGICCRPNDRRGFLHKKLLGLGRKALGVGASFIPGPVGGLARLAVERIPGGGAPPPRGRGFRPGRGRGINFPFSGAPGAGFNIFGSQRLPRISIGERSFSGGRGGEERVPADIQNVIQAGQRMQAANAVNGGCPPEAQVCAPRGFHLNKSSYFLRDGTFIERGTKFVRNRRLNNANGRAQGKAITRLEKGAENAKKLLKATGWRTISKQSSRELRMRRRGHR